MPNRLLTESKRDHRPRRRPYQGRLPKSRQFACLARLKRPESRIGPIVSRRRLDNRRRLTHRATFLTVPTVNFFRHVQANSASSRRCRSYLSNAPRCDSWASCREGCSFGAKVEPSQTEYGITAGSLTLFFGGDMHHQLRRALPLAISLAALLPAQEPAARPAAPGRGAAAAVTGSGQDPAAVERGAKLFASNCGGCHGVAARGGPGAPDLLRSIVVLDERRAFSSLR